MVVVGDVVGDAPGLEVTEVEGGAVTLRLRGTGCSYRRPLALVERWKSGVVAPPAAAEPVGASGG